MVARVSPNPSYLKDNNMKILSILWAYETLRSSGLVLLIMEVGNMVGSKEKNWISLHEDIIRQGIHTTHMQRDSRETKGSDLHGNFSK